MRNELSGRLETRAPADYTTTGFGAQGDLPGETTTHCVGGAVKSDHDAQRVATSQGGAAWSIRRQSTLDDLAENAKELVCEEVTVGYEPCKRNVCDSVVSWCGAVHCER